MESRHYALIIDLLCVMAGALVIVPIAAYLWRPWETRRDQLLSYFGADSLPLYYKQFYPGIHVSLKDMAAEFRQHFARNFGRRHFVFPVAILVLIAAFATFAAARTLQASQKVAPADRALPPIILASLAGAVIWVINDVVSRVRRRDLTPADIYTASFRLVIAPAFGWSFAHAVKDEIGVPLALFLGAFPTGTLFTIARRLASTRLNVAEDPATGALELEKLQGITKTNAERFYDEGVTTIVQLAYADPIILAIRTNFDIIYVIDCVSQALLWIYFGDRTSTLYRFSLRGSQEVCYFVRQLGDPATQASAAITLDGVATTLEMSAGALQNTLEQVAADPYSVFLWSVWR